MAKTQSDPRHLLDEPEPRKPPLDPRIRGRLGEGMRALYTDLVTQAPTEQMAHLLERLDKRKP